MNIAFVAQPFDGVLPPEQNSIGLIIYNTARSLAETEDVTVYVPAKSPDERPRDVDGLQIVPVSTAFDRRVEVFFSRYPSLFGSYKILQSRFYYLVYALRIAWHVRRAQHDVVHILNFPQFAQVIRRWARASTRISLEMQSEWLTQWSLHAVMPGMRACTWVWGVSSHVTDLIEARFPQLPAKLGISYNGFEPARFGGLERREPDPATPTLIFVGRVSPEKAVHVLIDAVGELIGEFPGLQLRIIGPRTMLGPEFIVDISDDPLVQDLARFYDGRTATDYQQYLDAQVERLGLGGNVTFTGPIYQAGLVDEYLGATLLVNPSFSESFGMTLVEAMATGCPVIGSRVGGMRDIVVDHESGRLVAAGDVAALADAISDCLSNPEDRARLAANGQRRATETFSWPARAARLREAFAGR